MKYWARINKKSAGPFSPEQLRKIDEVDEETFVCPASADAAPEWTRLKDVPALLKALQAPPAPAPEPEPAAPPAPPPAAPAEAAPSRFGWLLIALPLGALVFGATVLGLRRNHEEAVRQETERIAKQRADEAEMAEEARKSEEQRKAAELTEAAAAMETRLEQEARQAAAQQQKAPEQAPSDAR